MALDTELKIVVKQLSKEMKFNENVVVSQK